MSEPLQISDKAREAAKACELAAVNHDQGLLTYNQYVELVEAKIQIAIDEETKPLWEMLERMADIVKVYELRHSKGVSVMADYYQLLKSKGQTK